MNITNDLVTEYINSFYEPLNDKLAALRVDAEEKNIPIILKETESFLNVLLKLTNPKRILEIGTAVGYSACYFASFCIESEVVTIEKNPKMLEIAEKNINDNGFTNRITAYNGDGEEIINKLVKENCFLFDLIFIDASKSHYKRFFDSAIKLSHNGTIIVSDNILMRAMTVSSKYDKLNKHKTNIARMREYIDYINSLKNITTSIISCGDGLAISVCRGNNE